MAIIVPILSTFNPDGVNKAQRAFKGLSGTAKTASIAFGALGVAVGKFGFDSVKAAAEDQKAQLKLAKTLQNVTGATDAQTAAVEKFITAQQFATGVADTQLRPALETLVRATGDVTKAQELLKLGLDVSAGTGRDLESISIALAKAQGGQFTALQRLGIVIPDNIKKTKDFAKVQEYLNTLFGGQAAVAAGTFQGKLEILKQRLQEAQETIGAKLIPILTNLVDYFLNIVVPAIERVANGGFKQLVIEIANTLSGLSGVAKLAKEVAFAFIGIKIALVAFTIAPPLIAAVTGALTTMRIAALYGAEGFKILGVAIKTSLASSGIGLLVIGLGLVVGKLIEMRIESQNTTSDIVIMSKTATNRFQAMEDAANKVVIKMDDISFAARHASDTLENKRLEPRTKINYDLKAQRDAAAAAKLASQISNNALTKTAEKTVKVVAAVFDLSRAGKLAQKEMAKLTTELANNNDILAKAKESYANFKDGVKNVITGIIDFGAAATAETGSFVENLIAQAAKAANFGSKVQQLLSMGLSESAIGQVLAAGADVGTKIADEIIAGGATVVTQVNDLVSATQSVADAVGESAAAQFYQAGVTAGQALVDGVKAAIASSGFSIGADNQIINSGAIAKVAAKLAQYKKPTSTMGAAISPAERQVITNLATSLGVPVPAMAAGGIVTKPTLALIGEAGPEAVVPLNGRNAGMGNTINLTVNAGMGADGNQIGREIVDIIKRYERVSGPVFASA